jgi:pimeloyl-ACP methyl ester carboxylesterase
MPRAEVDAIELEYETFGEPGDPPLLLVSGLGAQMVSWDVDFCEALVGRGFFVVRFDNRDVGLSTKLDPPAADLAGAIAAVLAGGETSAPYLLSDMASDAWGLLDHLAIDRAHIVGMSMGGMIVQAMAIQRPERVLSLTSIMSMTGELPHGQPDPDVIPLLFETAPSEREANIAHNVELSRTISSPEFFDEDRAHARAALSFDRCFYPVGVANQTLAILASGSRDEALRTLDVPALVVHGTEDPLVTPSGGEHTAEVLRGSELILFDGMGHDLPAHYWSQIIDAICSVATRTVSTSTVSTSTVSTSTVSTSTVSTSEA